MLSVRRLLGAAVAVAAAVMVVPSAAQAAEPAPFTFTVNNVNVTPAGKYTTMSLRSLEGAPHSLTDVKVVIDATAVADFATVWVPQFSGGEAPPTPSKDCTVADSVITCSWPSLGDFSGWILPYLKVEAKEGAKVGRSGKISVTFSAKDLGPIVATSTVNVADDVDLVAGPVGAKATVEPGAVADAPIEIRNGGDKPVQGVVARFMAYSGLRLEGRYSNCVYRGENYDEAYCHFDQKLTPGTTYRVAKPIVLAPSDVERGKQYSYLHQWSTADDWFANRESLGDGMTPGTEGVLALEPVPVALSANKTTDSNGANNLAFGFLTINGSATSSPSPSASVTTTPATGTDEGGTGGTGGGSLPITGTNATIIAVVGVVLLAGGLAAFFLTRRRRARFTA